MTFAFVYNFKYLLFVSYLLKVSLCFRVSARMGQSESSPAEAFVFALPPTQPSPIKEEFKLNEASATVQRELKAIGDTLEKRKIGQ